MHARNINWIFLYQSVCDIIMALDRGINKLPSPLALETAHIKRLGPGLVDARHVPQVTEILRRRSERRRIIIIMSRASPAVILDI